MDAFFASVEQAAEPALRGKPVGVAGKSIIIAATYDARRSGVHVGVNVYEAKRLCPKIKIISANHRRYLEVSRRIAEYLYSISPSAVMYSIDEGFLDITDVEGASAEIAGRIRGWLKDRLKITGSVGVGPTYVTAKMATKVMKPDGYYEVSGDNPNGSARDRLAFMDRFALKEVWGIGRRTESSLKARGLFSLADIRRRGEETIKHVFGDIRGASLFRLACGLDSERPATGGDSKSISRSTTAKEGVRDTYLALAYLLRLSEAVSAKARKGLYAGKTVTLYIRDAHWEGFSYRRGLRFYTSAAHHIYEAVKSLFLERVNADIPIRVFGVSLEGLYRGGAVLANLEDFINGDDERYIKLYKAIDRINETAPCGIQRCATLSIPKYDSVGCIDNAPEGTGEDSAPILRRFIAM
jgi:DNA polymerase-4